MKRWSRMTWYVPVAKQAPPAHGIRMQKAGTTWWGQRWIEALQQILRGDAARLARGRTYARAGRAHDVVIQAGKVTAKVTGSRATPYRITIALGELGAEAWNKAIAAMAEKAQFTAELLAGQMPKEIDEAFRAAGTSLFPKERAHLVTHCSCPDWGDPCKHVAATHYVLGEALDRDPFLLFELRGRTKEQVLAALRAVRGGGAGPKGERRNAAQPGDVAPEVPHVSLGTLKPADYDRAREALPPLHFSFEVPSTHGALLRQLGTPAAWEGARSPADTLAPLLHAAAERARKLALREPDEPAAPTGGAPRSASAQGKERAATKRPDRGIGTRRLDLMIAEATGPCRNESDHSRAWFEVLARKLGTPFRATARGVVVNIAIVDRNEDGEIMAVWSRGRRWDKVPILELVLPDPPPDGAEWIEAYRHFRAR